MTMTYDLITQPWLPVRDADGQTHTLNLRDLFRLAPTLREILDPLPTVEFGLYRLLIALVLDIFQPHNTEALETLLGAGAFDTAVVDAYFRRHADRFDLFHPKHPFLQTGGMTAEAAKPLAGLLPSLPSGTNANHFHHSHEDAFGVTPAVAARLLTAVAPFMTAGGAGLAPSVNGAPGWYVLIHGRTLFETLCFNTPVPPFLPEGLSDTPPAWRNDQPPTGDRCTRTSLLEALTWRPRRLQLVPGGPGRCALTGAETPTLISTMKFTAGASCALTTWRDPSAAYRITKDGPLLLRPQEGKQLWRDTGPLALIGDDHARPRLVDQFVALTTDGWWDGQTHLDLTLYGMRTDLKMKVFEWQRERLTLPTRLVVQGGFHQAAQAAMDSAGDVARGLRAAIKMAYPRKGDGNKSAFDERIAEAQRQFWADLRPHYDAYLDQIARLSPEDDAPQFTQFGDAWRATVQDLGKVAFEDAIRDLDTDAQALKRRVEARRQFHKSLFFAFATPDQLKPKKGKAAAAPAAQGETP